MKIEIIINREELDRILEEAKDDTAVSVEQADDGLKVNFSQVLVSANEFVEMAAHDCGIDTTKVAVESVTVLKDGSVALLLMRKV